MRGLAGAGLAAGVFLVGCEGQSIDGRAVDLDLSDAVVPTLAQVARKAEAPDSALTLAVEARDALADAGHAFNLAMAYLNMSATYAMLERGPDALGTVRCARLAAGNGHDARDLRDLIKRTESTLVDEFGATAVEATAASCAAVGRSR